MCIRDRDHTAPYAGTIEMLDRLRAAGVQLAVLTNKDHVSAAPLIELSLIHI